VCVSCRCLCRYAEQVALLAAKARSVVRDLDPTNDLTFMRIRSKRHETMIAPGRSLMTSHPSHPPLTSLTRVGVGRHSGE
jgi:hypothetical protein